MWLQSESLLARGREQASGPSASKLRERQASYGGDGSSGGREHGERDALRAYRGDDGDQIAMIRLGTGAAIPRQLLRHRPARRGGKPVPAEKVRRVGHREDASNPAPSSGGQRDPQQPGAQSAAADPRRDSERADLRQVGPVGLERYAAQ